MAWPSSTVADNEGRRSVRFAQLVEAGRPNSRSSVWIVDMAVVMDMDMVLVWIGHGKTWISTQFLRVFFVYIFSINTVWCELCAKKVFSKESSAIY